MKLEDFQGEPCTCPACLQAGVSELQTIRDRYTGMWLHGYDLKRWHAARAAFWQAFHEVVGKHERRSPDGDGLPMEKGLGEGPSLSEVSKVRPQQADVHARRGRHQDSLKPAAGSEPADAHTKSRTGPDGRARAAGED